jgi:16S rRNA (cytidine1402-2'-O)-methyltransferase
VALVSDAGTPGLSDPGYRLIQACINSGIDLEVLPGPFAAITALVASGLPSDRFFFQGFLPKKQGQRRKLLQELSGEKSTLIFYESCHRIEKSLEDIREVLGERRIALARELTKKFEQTIRSDTSEVIEIVKSQGLKGEIVVVIAGAPDVVTNLAPKAISDQLRKLIAGGLTKKEAIKQLSAQTGMPKRTVYEAVKDISFSDAEN